MFYVIFFAVIAFALYLILHDRGEGEGKSLSASSQNRSQTSRYVYRPEQSGPVPQTPAGTNPKPQTPTSSPTPKPLEPAPLVKPLTARPAAPAAPNRNVAERPLSWSYLSSLDYDEDIDGDTMETEITGMRYYCSFSDVGPVNGIVRPEPGNPNDPRAHVVIRADGKKLGYIPRTALDEYADFNEDDLTCPFAGRIKITRQGYIWADILVALPESLEFVKAELTEFVDSQSDSN